jgi:branched-chain amino acid transport system substrate-binding protein
MRRLLWLAILLAGLLAACGGPATSEPTKAPAAAPSAPAAATNAPAAPTTAPGAPTTAAAAAGPKEILLGAALPLTGGQSREGGFFKKAYEMAVKEVNAGGGIMIKEFNRKIPVRLIIYDDKSETTTSVQMYEKLATEDKVDAFLGGYSTALIQAHVVVPAKYQIPYVNGGGATGAIYAQGNKWIFGLLASIEKLSSTLMDWLELQQDAGKLPKPSKIAMVGENTSHGVEFRKGVNDRAKAKPDRFTVVVDEAFEINAKDFSPIIAKIKTAGADIFLADARLADYTLMQRQYTEAGLYHKVVSYGPRGPEKAARDALGSASDYIVAANWWSADMTDASSKEFIAKYKAYANEDPEWFAALGYETARVMFSALERAGSLDKTKVRDALATTNLSPSMLPGGKTYFKENGQIDNPYVMSQNMPGGKVSLIFPKDLANGEAVVPMPK